MKTIFLIVLVTFTSFLYGQSSMGPAEYEERVGSRIKSIKWACQVYLYNDIYGNKKVSQFEKNLEYKNCVARGAKKIPAQLKRENKRAEARTKALKEYERPKNTYWEVAGGIGSYIASAQAMYHITTSGQTYAMGIFTSLDIISLDIEFHIDFDKRSKLDFYVGSGLGLYHYILGKPTFNAIAKVGLAYPIKPRMKLAIEGRMAKEGDNLYAYWASVLLKYDLPAK